MNAPISLLTCTQQEFTEQIFQRLGKGRLHAALVYEEFFRTGKIEGLDPAFGNARPLFKKIVENLDIQGLSLADQRTDGATGKILFKTQENLEVEAVLIPMRAGGTLCISSQVGCRMGCVFCETGRMGLLKNLSSQEIVSQVFVSRHALGFAIRNIVFMGMGEPFDNYEAVIQAVRVLTDPKGLGFGCRHITISTSGCIEGIERLTEEGAAGPNLAVSITAPNDSLRSKLMPINRKHSLSSLHEAMQRYCRQTGRQILIAYVLLKGQNDSLEHADELARYLDGLDVKINLIPYNPQSCDRFESPAMETLENFKSRLRENGHTPLLRLTKGSKIMAACGQLGNVQLRRQMREMRGIV